MQMQYSNGNLKVNLCILLLGLGRRSRRTEATIMRIRNSARRQDTGVLYALTCFVLLGALASSAAGLNAGQSPGMRTFPLKGVVREVHPETQSLLVAHESVPGYMDAMTMPFRVKEANFPGDLQIGDQIVFQLHVTDQESWVEQISRIGHRSGEQFQTFTTAPVVVPASKPRHPLLDCRFTNELGQVVKLADFRGQALAITFFFTRCPVPDYCPRLSRNFEEASMKLLGMANAPTNWHFLSFSFDPAYDTSATLKTYAERYHYDPRHWSLLTGAPEKIAELAAQADVTFQPDQGFFTHNFRTLIIDAAGHLQTTFPIGGNLSDAIVSEILKAAIVTAPPALASAHDAAQPTRDTPDK